MHGPLLLRVGVLLASSAAAGAVNAVAGGGTLITFPTLIWLGLGSIHANATSTVGIVPGAFSSAWGYRREVREVQPWLIWVLPSSFLGGLVGAIVLTKTPQDVFDTLVPFLVLGATLLFMVNEPITRWLRGNAQQAGPGHRWLVVISQFVIAFYGGYFGAGMGIMMLAALGLLQLGSIHRMNGLKTLSGAAVNGVASVLFMVKGLVHWPEALTMVVGSVLGGYYAADAARKLGQRAVRGLVVAIGLIAAAVLGIQRFVG